MLRLDNDFANAAFIPNADDYLRRWPAEAAAFRAEMASQGRLIADVAYGPSQRQRFDLFLPQTHARGVVVFVHGGYWLRFDRTDWSHFAAGPLARGWAVALPSYDLCPSVSIAQITDQIETAITAISDRLDGPLRLTGHSAGGHLVARMICADRSPSWRHRLQKVVPISPVADLRPLLWTSMNEQFQLTEDTAAEASPVLHDPVTRDVHVVVGAAERPVFVAQARELASAWDVPLSLLEDRHHFDVIDGLCDPTSDLVRAIVE